MDKWFDCSMHFEQKLNPFIVTDKSPECSLLNLRATRIAMVFAMILMVFSNASSLGYSLRPLGMMSQEYLTGNKVRRELPFKTEFVCNLKLQRMEIITNYPRYPYDEYEDPMYEFTYVFNGLTGTICVFGLSGMDGIFIALCLHISAQFQIIQYDFGQLMPFQKNGMNKKVKLIYGRQTILF